MGKAAALPLSRPIVLRPRIALPGCPPSTYVVVVIRLVDTVGRFTCYRVDGIRDARGRGRHARGTTETGGFSIPSYDRVAIAVVAIVQGGDERARLVKRAWKRR